MVLQAGEGKLLVHFLERHPNRNRQWLLQAESLKIGFYEFTTLGSGRTLSLPAILLYPSTSWDTDGDGLHDEGELVMGTNVNDMDSDGDGVWDGPEVRQGTNPLDGIPAATGILASVNTPGTAVDVCAVDDIAVVADSGSGVSVVDIQTIASPVIVAQVDTPGNAVAVACSGDLIAVADGLAGLAVIDISDPPAAEIVHQVALGGAAQAVVAGGGVAYVGLTSGELAVVDLESGALIGQLSFSQAVEDLALAGDRLYVLTAGELHAIFIEDLSVVGSAASPGSSSRRHHLFVGGGVAYTAHSRGYNTFDISSPGAPALIAAGNTTQFGWKQIVPNGSGLGVAVVGATLGAGNVSLYDVSDALARIHRMTALGTAHEEARGCSCESGIMVLEQKPARKQGAPNRCCHRTNPTVSASSLTTIAWWPMPACSCRPPSPGTWACENSSTITLTSAARRDGRTRGTRC